MRTATLERRRVPLSRGADSFPTQFVVLDSDGETVRAAFYRMRTPVEEAQPISEDQLRVGVELGWFAEPRDEKAAARMRQAWRRRAGRSHRLGVVLAEVLEGSSHDWRTVETYVRSTAWGAGLP